jgi:hypothetical protein
MTASSGSWNKASAKRESDIPVIFSRGSVS